MSGPDDIPPDAADSEGGECDLRPSALRLAPCPFCGAGTFDISEARPTWSGGLSKPSEPLSVSVRHWCEPAPGQPSRMIERIGRDRESALAAWNRRAQPAPDRPALTLDERYWLDRRPDIIGALEDAGVQIMSDAKRVWARRTKPEGGPALADALRQCEDALHAVYDGIAEPRARKLVEGAVFAARAALAGAPEPSGWVHEREKDLAMLVARLARALRKADPKATLPDMAACYLTRHRLLSPLRDDAEARAALADAQAGREPGAVRVVAPHDECPLWQEDEHG